MASREPAAETGWRAILERLQAGGIDAVLIAILLAMGELLVVAFSGRRGPTGLLLGAEQILDLLSYGRWLGAGILLAVLWALGSRWLGVNPWVLVGAKAYLAQHGTPRRPADLEAHAALVYSSVQGDERWHFTGADGAAVSVPVKGPLRSNNLSALLAAARAGMGLAILPWYVAHDSVQSGAVLPLLERWSLPTQEVHAVFPSPRLVPTKVSGFVDWLQGQFGERWWAQPR